MTYIREAFAAAYTLALMRFLASMGANVNCQCTSLDEALSTAKGTRVRPLICVYAVVSLQIRFTIEALYTL